MVYRRRGWSYGVIHLKVDASEALTPEQGALAVSEGQESSSVGSATG